jgi:GntR family transcriptional regulator
MKFYIDKNSSTPVASQLQEQIKLAVMMGIFRNGDTLPSIRDVEKQTGINRSQIHKAYLALRRSGLLVLTRGKGTVVATSPDSPRTVEESCRKLSKQIIARVRQMGLSPTAFARYLGRHSQENEHNSPLIFFVDTHEEIAAQTAEEIARLWQVPVRGIAIWDLKAAIGRGSIRHKILANHIMCDNVRSMLPRNKSDVIPVELHSSALFPTALEKIPSNASVVVIHRPQFSHSIKLILAGIRKMLEPRGVMIASCSVRDASDFRKLVKSSGYDYYVAGPLVRGDVPPEMRQDPRILTIQAQLDPASLETARIRAGVII